MINSQFHFRDSTDHFPHRATRVTTNGHNSKGTINGYENVGNITALPSVRKRNASCIHICGNLLLLLSKAIPSASVALMLSRVYS